MKSVALRSISTATALAILLISLQLYAQNVPSGTGQIHYSVINLGTLGGAESNGFGGVNNRGWVTGDANLAGDQNEHAFLWRGGVMTDLGTLGGLNSSIPYPTKDDRGLVVGVAQTATVDPLGEFWGGDLCLHTLRELPRVAKPLARLRMEERCNDRTAHAWW